MSENTDIVYMPRGLKACAFKGKLAQYSSRRLHRHPHHEVLLIKNGISLLIDENWRRPQLGAGFALIPAGAAHRSLVVGKGLEYMLLFFRESVHALGTGDIEVFGASELGLALFNRLCAVNSVEISKGAPGECLRLFLRVLEEDRRKKAPMIGLPEAKEPGNRRIAEYIGKNYGSRITVRDLERTAHYSARHLARKFSGELGMGIFEYLRRHRILMASVLLSGKERKITDIAFDCGYSSLSSFYRDFGSFFGVSPKTLRAAAG